MQSLASRHYARVQQATADARGIEAALLRQANSHLHAARAASPEAAPALRAQALSDNLRLWSAFEADLLHPDNRLSPPLRQSLLSLAARVRRESLSALSGRDIPDELIAVNDAIIDGLQASLAASANEGALA
jgi:flagellar biosynthesis regulator FlaF